MKFKITQKKTVRIATKLSKLWRLTGNDFEVFTLEEDFTRSEFYDKFGQGSTFPQVLCDEELLGGCVDTIRFLKRKQVIKS